MTERAPEYRRQMALNRLPNADRTALAAREARRQDEAAGLEPDATRHGARIGSAWAGWYNGGDALLSHPISQTDQLSRIIAA